MVSPLFLFICVSLCIQSAMSLSIPPSLKHSPLGTFSTSHVTATFPELAFYAISITAILFCVVGAFVLSVVGSARVLSIIERFPRGATLRNTIRRLPLLSPFTTADGAGRIAPRPTRRGGVARPVAGLTHGRWSRRQGRNAANASFV